MTRFALICVIVFCANGVLSIPLEEPVAEKAIPAENVAVLEPMIENLDAQPSKDSSKFFHNMLPPFLMGAKPSPGAFGNATVNGEVGGLFATNDNSLYVESGPNSSAIANLTSTAAYFATPINTTDFVMSEDGSEIESQNLAGFTVTAQEDTIASAQGEYIQFINHGASYATGWGDSTANGTSYNEKPPPAAPAGGSGSGWKQPPKGNQAKPNSKPREEEEKAPLI